MKSVPYSRKRIKRSWQLGTPDQGALVPSPLPFNRATPGSNLHSNVEDMARWIQVNLNRRADGRRIQSSSYDMLETFRTCSGRNWHVGMLVSHRLHDERIVMHSGG